MPFARVTPLALRDPPTKRRRQIEAATIFRPIGKIVRRALRLRCLDFHIRKDLAQWAPAGSISDQA